MDYLNIHKNIFTYNYSLNTNENYFVFSKDEILLFYHLSRFQYFDREMLNDICFITSEDMKISKRKFYQLIGNRNYPISEFERLVDRRKIYYLNRRFVTWIHKIMNDDFFLNKKIQVTEFNKSYYSSSATNATGGNPIKIFKHDLNTKRYVLKIARSILEKVEQPNRELLNIQFAFPISKDKVSLVPDAALFVRGVCYFIEYDRNTEQQYKLLAKIIGYFQIDLYTGSHVFFIFDNISQSRYKGLHLRIRNFVRNITNKYFGESGYTFKELLLDANVKLLLSSYDCAISDVSFYIMKHLGLKFADIEQKQFTVKNERRDDDFIVEQVYSTSELYLDGIVLLHDFIDGKFNYPYIIMPYYQLDMYEKLEQIYLTYYDVTRYNKIILFFSKSLEDKEIEIPHSDFFIPKYI